MNTIFLCLGSNLGNRELNLRQAVMLTEQSIGQIILSSSVYITEPWGFQAEYEFLNLVLKAETNLPPQDLLVRISSIESSLGRIEIERRYESRIIDIDILLFGDLIIDSDNLKIPHPLIPERRFVLVPLCEVAPEAVHPVLKKTFSSLLTSCPDKSRVEKWRKTPDARR